MRDILVTGQEPGHPSGTPPVRWARLPIRVFDGARYGAKQLTDRLQHGKEHQL
jgi:hypothetical protein